MFYMRKRRELLPLAEYHVIAKANRSEFIFESTQVKKLFLEILKQAKKRYRFKIRTFCIMNNHIHLMITPGENENLSRILQWILSVFAIRFNKMFGFHGHVWYDRFKSVLIRTIKQVYNTFIYIADNPVKAGIVENAIDYPYSGVRHLFKRNYSIIETPNRTTAKILSMVLDL